MSMPEHGRPCECGCGEIVLETYTRNRRELGYIKGEFRRFKKGHASRGELAHNWNGGRTLANGYVMVKSPGHSRAHRDYVYEHILVAEEALGKPLPRKTEVHHVSGNKTDNGPRNLVICEDRAYHMLLHRRQRALDECGHPDWLSCVYCHGWAPAAALTVCRNGTAYHARCMRDNYRQQQAQAAMAEAAVRDDWQRVMAEMARDDYPESPDEERGEPTLHRQELDGGWCEIGLHPMDPRAGEVNSDGQMACYRCINRWCDERL